MMAGSSVIGRGVMGWAVKGWAVKGWSVIGLAVIGLAVPAGFAGFAQPVAGIATADEAQTALKQALAEAAAADARGRKFEAEALGATEEADRTARQAAALAARIQQAEADIAAADARIALIADQRIQLDTRLAERRGPLVRLTAALQKLARRPLALSALRPGSLRETVYLRAMLETAIPQVRRRTADLRAEIDRGRQLENAARKAAAGLRSGEEELARRRTRLAAMETRQRLASRSASGDASRELERALALAEEARDLDALVGRLDAAGALRQELAALPGPVMRPGKPEDARVSLAAATPAAATSAAPGRYQLPVNGRTVTGFGAPAAGGSASNGISLAPRPGAQVVAPGAGRVVFAGPYRGYERIVIIEHGGGWTSVVTGLGRSDAVVGDVLVGGGPLGVAGGTRPVVSLELRRNGAPVNPLEYLR